MRQTQNKLARAAFGALAAFTAIELLVTMVVLALLIGMIATIGPSLYYQQRASTTRATMSSALLAIDQFSAENPLGQYYNRRGRETFGRLPPYQLAGSNGLNNLRGAFFEPHDEQPKLTGSTNPPNNNDYTLSVRMERDLRSGEPSGASGDAPNSGTYVRRTNVSREGTALGAQNRAAEFANTDDIASLHNYLRAYAPDALATVRDNVKQSVFSVRNLSTSHSRLRYFNVSGKPATLNPGQTPTSGQASPWAESLGFVDAWGVPLDYVIAAKLEYGLRTDGTVGYRIVDRRPVLRSLGVDREKYETAVQLLAQGSGAQIQGRRIIGDPGTWIWSEDLPRPYFTGYGANGIPSNVFNSDPASTNFGDFAPTDMYNLRSAGDGWVRMVGLGENYSFRPDMDRLP